MNQAQFERSAMKNVGGFVKSRRLSLEYAVGLHDVFFFAFFFNVWEGKSSLEGEGNI